MAGLSVILLRVAFSYNASKKYGTSGDFKVCIYNIIRDRDRERERERESVRVWESECRSRVYERERNIKHAMLHVRYNYHHIILLIEYLCYCFQGVNLVIIHGTTHSFSEVLVEISINSKWIQWYLLSNIHIDLVIYVLLLLLLHTWVDFSWAGTSQSWTWAATLRHGMP